MKLGFSRQIFEKSINIKFHQYLSCGSRVVRCRQKEEQKERRTDGHNKTNKSLFRNFANAPKTPYKLYLCNNEKLYLMQTTLSLYSVIISKLYARDSPVLLNGTELYDLLLL